ncbi:hypothetical protein [Methylobacterium iners]|uniref:hypothetical protein n=1 Tax=Methylobacterium iners TaxID=418707 RepID=UPI0035A22BEA
MRADRVVQVCLALRKSDAGLEPLPVAGNQADEGHGRVADVAGEQDDVVETQLGRGVEDVIGVERGEASGVKDVGRGVRMGCDRRWPDLIAPENAVRVRPSRFGMIAVAASSLPRRDGASAALYLTNA